MEKNPAKMVLWISAIPPFRASPRTTKALLSPSWTSTAEFLLRSPEARTKVKTRCQNWIFRVSHTRGPREAARAFWRRTTKKSSKEWAIVVTPNPNRVLKIVGDHRRAPLARVIRVRATVRRRRAVRNQPTRKTTLIAENRSLRSRTHLT